MNLKIFNFKIFYYFLKLIKGIKQKKKIKKKLNKVLSKCLLFLYYFFEVFLCRFVLLNNKNRSFQIS